MELKLNHKVATLAVDNSVIITKKNGAVDMLFLQFTKDAPTPEADVVASIRLGSIAELEDLQKAMSEAIQKHRTAEV